MKSGKKKTSVGEGQQNLCKVRSLFFEREREREGKRKRQSMSGEGQRERETQHPKQAPGSKISAQSLTRGSNS